MNKERILVVDDDESVLEYLETALEIMGYDVTPASSGAEAIEKLKAASENIPLMITDISMPGMSGNELLNVAKKSYPELIVVMLTANVSVQAAIQSLNEGAFAFLTKPVNPDELSATIKNAFEKYNLMRDNKRLVEELHKAKDYLENIVQNLVYIVVATDSEGFIKKTNKAVEKLLGYTQEELIGSPIQILFSEEFKQKAWLDLADKDRVTNFPVTFISKEGTEKKLSFSGTIMKNASGQIIGFLGTAAG